MNEQPKKASHINLIGPFETYRDYLAKSARCKLHPRRAECRHKPVEGKFDNQRVVKLASYDRQSVLG